jgi:hypothetical protein
VSPVGAWYGTGVPKGKQLSCRLHALGEKHPILAGATLGAGNEIVDLINESAEERLVFGLEAMGERRERDIGRLSNSKSRLSNEFLALLTNMSELGNLLVYIDIDVQKACWILMDDAILLTIEEVEESSILLEFVLQGGDDLFEFLLDVHNFK